MYFREEKKIKDNYFCSIVFNLDVKDVFYFSLNFITKSSDFFSIYSPHSDEIYILYDKKSYIGVRKEKIDSLENIEITNYLCCKVFTCDCFIE